MKKNSIRIIGAASLFFPAFSFAAGTLDTTNLGTLITSAINLIKNGVIPLIILLIMLAFFWGVFLYIWKAKSDPKAHAEGRQFMIWAIVAIAVVFSWMGLVSFLQGTFGIKNNSGFIPQVQTSGGTGGVSNTNVIPGGVGAQPY